MTAVDLDTVRRDLAAAVHTALEPAHVSVWIDQRTRGRREPPRSVANP